MEQQIVTPLTLRVPRELWEKFKNKTPRMKTLNEALIELIEKKVKENES